MTDPQPQVTFTTEQLVAALVSGLLPLAGPTGVAASALVPAAEQLLDTLRNHASTNFTVDDLAAIVSQGNVDLAKLAADINAKGGAA